jgi:methionyl-tRNA synthetase
MNKHEEWLKEWIETGKLNGVQQHDPSEWRKQVIGQCKSWIDNGLQPRSITRDLDWGVQVPVEGGEGKVLYVWFDAPIGYISATKKWAEDKNKNWEDYWKKDDTALIHFIGKDNIVFHGIIFPIILKEQGDYILPTNVPANEFLNLEGDKISTSRNWAVWLHEYLEDFPGRQDELRYVLTSIAPETKDSEFTWKDYQARVNNELVAIFGNFINRSIVLTHKYYNGIVPEPGELRDADQDVLRIIETTKKRIEESLSQFKFRDAQVQAMDIARLGNKYLADREPWKLIKTDEERVKTIMFIALQISNALSIVFDPFLPKTSNKLRSILNNNTPELKAGHQINAAELLFQKIEDEAIDAQIEKLKASPLLGGDLGVGKTPPGSTNHPPQGGTNPKAKAMKDEITFDDFTKIDIRTATILTAEKHPDADKLLKLTVDTGIDVRTVVSGIAEHYKPEDIIGKQVSILMNLAPRKIRGIESKGMILMAENNEGELAFVSPEKAMDNGGEIR